MVKQVINIGTVPNDGNGDLLRDAMIKVNDNFTELYTNAQISISVAVGNSTVNTFINSSSISATNVIVSNDLTVSGNVYFQGETTFSNAVNITTTDKNLILANTATNNALANGAGLIISAIANLVYIGNATVSTWQSNVGITPSTNNLSFGNTGKLWNVYANTLESYTSNSNVSTIATSISVANALTVNSTKIVVGNSVGLVANGSTGNAFEFLTSNGSAIYWGEITSLSIDRDSQYNWTNLHSFANTVTFTGSILVNGNAVLNTITYFTKSISANGSFGTNNYVLVTSGASSTNSYWGVPRLITTANNTDANTYYLPMTNTSTSNLWSNAVVASSLSYVPSTGTLNATIFNSTSDSSVKENIKIIEDAVDIITNLNGVRFNWKESGKPSAGLIAQEVETKMPELVETNPETGIKSLNYSGIIAILVEAVKYLIEKENNKVS